MKDDSQKNIKVTEESFEAQDEEGLRLDVFVSKRMPDTPRTIIQKGIKEETVVVNKEKAKPSYHLKKGDVVDVKIEEVGMPDKIQPQPKLPLKIISQNKDFLVIEKPIGISVHPSEHEHEGTVVNWLVAHFPDTTLVGEDKLRPGIVHRLDKDTSGILIVARNQKCFDFLKKSFKERKIKKRYVALCWGKFEKKMGSISTYIGKSATNPRKQATSFNQNKLINPKDAFTYYAVIDEKEGVSQVEVEIKTGRKHQIRIHLQSIGHPILGDKAYFTKETRKKNEQMYRMFLHSSYLAFEYLDGNKYEFSSPLPPEFSIVFKEKNKLKT